jgi:hypothetical protein
MDELFKKIPDLPNQLIKFTKPQRGGNAFKKNSCKQHLYVPQQTQKEN